MDLFLLSFVIVFPKQYSIFRRLLTNLAKKKKDPCDKDGIRFPVQTFPFGKILKKNVTFVSVYTYALTLTWHVRGRLSNKPQREILGEHGAVISMSSYGFRTIRGKIGGKKSGGCRVAWRGTVFLRGRKKRSDRSFGREYTVRRCSPTTVGRKTRLLLSVACAATVTALFTFLIKQISGGENELSRLELSAISPRNTRKLRASASFARVA